MFLLDPEQVALQLVLASGLPVEALRPWKVRNRISALVAWDERRAAVWAAMTVSMVERPTLVVMVVEGREEIGLMSRRYPRAEDRPLVEVFVQHGLGDLILGMFDTAQLN